LTLEVGVDFQRPFSYTVGRRSEAMAKFVVSSAGGGKYKTLFAKPIQIENKEYFRLGTTSDFTAILDKSKKPWLLTGAIGTPKAFETYLRDGGADEQT
jgi:hypothetical protein